MIELHLEFLTQNGQKQFAVLPDDEFLKITEYKLRSKLILR